MNLGPTQGAEIRKTSPVIMVSDDAVGRLPLKIVVPLTDWKPHYAQAPWMVRVVPDQLTKLTKISAADRFQVRSISDTRFVKCLGQVDKHCMKKGQDGLAAVLSITQ